MHLYFFLMHLYFFLMHLYFFFDASPNPCIPSGKLTFVRKIATT